MEPTEELKKLKEKCLIKGKKLHLIYDTFGEGLEPTYYWILDFMREDLQYEVAKIYDQFAAAEASGFFGELGTRRTALEKRAMEIMQTLGVIVKSILQILWDLKEFELRLDHYDKLKSKDPKEREAADAALKAIWLTDVDIKKGRGSINMLTQDLNFITLRDAFMVAKSVEDIDKMDLNERVKRILRYKIKEYLDWRKRSEQELRKRYQVEKAWLKSQVNAMKLYTRWARPYLIATQKLMPPEKIEGAEDIVTAFDVARIDVTLFGTKEINKIERPGRAPLKVEVPEDEDKIYACIEIEFRYRTSPGVATERGHYIHRGRIDMFFRPYVMTGGQLKKMKQLEEDEVLQFLEGMTGESLEAMREELEKYLEEYDIKKIKEKLEKIETNEERIEYLEKILKGVKEEKLKKEIQKLLDKYKTKIKIPFVKEIKRIEEFVKIQKKVPRNIKILIKKLKSIAEKKAAKDCWTLYDTYKNAHKMVRW